MFPWLPKVPSKVKEVPGTCDTYNPVCVVCYQHPITNLQKTKTRFKIKPESSFTFFLLSFTTPFLSFLFVSYFPSPLLFSFPFLFHFPSKLRR
jgi:hypothetical protein